MPSAHKSSARQQRSLRSLLQPLDELSRGSEHLFAAPLAYHDAQGVLHTVPRYLFAGPGDKSSYLRVGIFAGIHGDEASGVDGALEFLVRAHADPELVRGYELFVYPVCNPDGYRDNSRWARNGKDLNREFWQNSEEIVVEMLERQLQKLQFNGIISLHSDDTSEGLYGFVKGHELTRHVLEPALEAASKYLPRNFDKSIDNFEANNGIIETGYEGILTAPPEQQPKPFEIVFETPHLAPQDKQIEAHIAALLGILNHFRTLISQGQNI